MRELKRLVAYIQQNLTIRQFKRYCLYTVIILSSINWCYGKYRRWQYEKKIENTTLHLPVIDLEPFFTKTEDSEYHQQKVLQKVKEACEKFGSFYVR